MENHNHHRMNRVAETLGDSTLSNSLESGVTVENSRGDAAAADSNQNECVGWTNERHNSYLDYLENSFVKQLYSFLGGETHSLSRPRDLRSNSHKSNDQFKVLHNGCWQKVNFEKKNSTRNNPDGNYNMGTSVQGNLVCDKESKHFGDKALNRTYLRHSLGNEYSAQSTAEASGQNFIEEEKGCDSEVTRKREREANNDDSSLKDQVVPVRMVKPRI